MHEVKLGKIIEGSAERDAIHIAVCPVLATQKLYPCQEIGLVPNDNYHVEVNDKPIGIVDPFLKEPVFPDQRFWMFLFPNTITSLRHDWTHPSFGNGVINLETTQKEAATAWIGFFAKELGQTYDQLIDAAHGWVEYENYTYDNSEAYRMVDHDKWPTFWKYHETLTGKKPQDLESCPYTCSC